MAIFISYSHADKEFVDELATRLVQNNAHVWVDSWELNVGDSLIDKVQSAVQDAGALLVILSKASVESSWCRKELNAGLVRELEEKTVIVLPVLKEDCKIPPFLKEKMYADFRSNFEEGFKGLLAAVAKITNTEQGRIKAGNTNTDWAETWGYQGSLFHLEWELVETSTDSAFTILTTISVLCNQAATRRYKEYADEGIGWIGRMIISDTLVLLTEEQEIHLLLEDARPKIVHYGLKDGASDVVYDITIRSRRMGEDNGKDQLVRVSNYLRLIGEYVRSLSRPPNLEEKAIVARILANRHRR